MPGPRAGAREKTTGAAGGQTSAELREVGHPACRTSLGRSEAKKLICVKTKSGKEKKQWHNGNTGNQTAR